MRKPWFRAQNSTWYVFDPATRKQQYLSKDKAEAFRKWHQMQAMAKPEAAESPVMAVLDEFLEWSKQNQSPATYAWYRGYLESFNRVHGLVPAVDLRPFHVTRWLAEAKYQAGAQRAAVISVKRALSWAVGEGLIPTNPLVGVRARRRGRRETLIAPETHQKLISKADRGHKRQYRQGAFRTFLAALRASGARPGELARLEARHVTLHGDTGLWVLFSDEHKTGERTGRKRVVYLTPCLATLTRILAHHRPTGRLFLNSEGKPWTANAVRCRMRRLREVLELPAGVVAYSYRHTYTTDAIVAGLATSTVAELLGHRDSSMIDRHYGHLDQRQEFLQKAARQVFKPAGDSG